MRENYWGNFGENSEGKNWEKILEQKFRENSKEKIFGKIER